MPATFENILQWMFWVSFAILFYTYIGYPTILALLGVRKTRDIHRDPSFSPPVSIVIAVHNEARHIQKRLSNCYTLDYPAEKLDFVVVSDGSTDGTDAIVRKLQDHRLSLCIIKERQGKAAALNLGVAHAQGQVILFTDARQSFAPDALRKLITAFADARVGAVTGELLLVDDGCETPTHTAGLYWHYEKWIRKAESQVHSTIGATGAIYAVRKHLFEPLPTGLILDDVMVPMRIAMKGYRVIFEEQAIAYDAPTATIEQEFYRKVRTLAGNFQILQLMPSLMSPYHNRLFAQYVSHKVTRLAAPYCLIALFLSSLLLHYGIYSVVFWMQLVGYTLAWAGWQLRRTTFRMPLTSLSLTFVMMHYASLLGFLYFLRARQRPTDVWVRS